MHYDFDDFLNVIKYLDLPDIILTSQQKLKTLAKAPVAARKDGAAVLATKIESLVYLLETQEKPIHLDDTDLAKLKNLCQSLVTKKQLDQKVMAYF